MRSWAGARTCSPICRPGAVLQAARDANLAVATAFHAAINLGVLLLFNEESGDKFALGSLAGVWVVAAVVTHLVTRRHAVPTAPREPALTT